MKAYLLVFYHPNTHVWLYELEDKRTSILQFLDTNPAIQNWLALSPNTLVVVSTRNASRLARLLDKELKGYQFLVVELASSKVDGKLPPDAWDFINTPKSSGRWLGLSELKPGMSPGLSEVMQGLFGESANKQELSGLAALFPSESEKKDNK